MEAEWELVQRGCSAGNGVGEESKLSSGLCSLLIKCVCACMGACVRVHVCVCAFVRECNHSVFLFPITALIHQLLVAMAFPLSAQSKAKRGKLRSERTIM